MGLLLCLFLFTSLKPGLQPSECLNGDKDRSFGKDLEMGGGDNLESIDLFDSYIIMAFWKHSAEKKL